MKGSVVVILHHPDHFSLRVVCALDINPDNEFLPDGILSPLHFSHQGFVDHHRIGFIGTEIFAVKTTLGHPDPHDLRIIVIGHDQIEGFFLHLALVVFCRHHLLSHVAARGCEGKGGALHRGVPFNLHAEGIHIVEYGRIVQCEQQDPVAVESKVLVLYEPHLKCDDERSDDHDGGNQELDDDQSFPQPSTIGGIHPVPFQDPDRIERSQVGGGVYPRQQTGQQGDPEDE